MTNDQFSLYITPLMVFKAKTYWSYLTTTQILNAAPMTLRHFVGCFFYATLPNSLLLLSQSNS